MALKVRYSTEQDVGDTLSPSQRKQRRALLAVFTFLSRFFLGLSIAAALAFGYLVISALAAGDGQDDKLISSLYFLQSGIELFLWHAVVSRAAELLAASEEYETPFFSTASTVLRRMAWLLLCLPVVGLVFSAAMSLLAYGSVANIGVTLGYAGFPVNAAWSALASGSLAMDLPNSVLVPLGSFIMPVVLFCVSYAFQYGSRLQQNEDLTI